MSFPHMAKELHYKLRLEDNFHFIRQVTTTQSCKLNSSQDLNLKREENSTMEGSTKTQLRCVSLLGILVLSFATTHQPFVVMPNSKTTFCAEKCGIRCVPRLEDPPSYIPCFGLCMIACRWIPTTLDDIPTYGCTRSCVSSASKVMTPFTDIPSNSGTNTSTGILSF